jgi:hypothetical protein
MTKIDIIHTPCKDCIFAEYDGDTQTSCALNKLEHYKNNGIEILEVYDDSKEFFVVNKKKCLYFRNNEWKTKKELRDITSAINLVNEEAQIKYIGVIYLEPETSIDTFNNIIESLLNQKIKPKGLMVIRDKHIKYPISVKQISDKLTQYDIPWRMQNFIDADMTFNDKVKAIIKSSPINRFYYLIYPSKYIYTNFIDRITSFIENGGIFGCININDNLFFSYLTLNYVKNINNLDLLLDNTTHTYYEKIN